MTSRSLPVFVLPLLSLLALSLAARPPPASCERVSVVRAVACICHLHHRHLALPSNLSLPQSALRVSDACVHAFGRDLAKLAPLCARRHAAPPAALSEAGIRRLANGAASCGERLPEQLRNAVKAIRAASIGWTVRYGGRKTPEPSAVVRQVVRDAQEGRDVRVARLVRYNKLEEEHRL